MHVYEAGVRNLVAVYCSLINAYQPQRENVKGIQEQLDVNNDIRWAIGEKPPHSVKLQVELICEGSPGSQVETDHKQVTW